MLVLFILSYMKFYNVTSNEYYFVADSFDYEKDGTFEMEIQSSHNSSLIVGFVTSDEMQSIRPIFELFYGYLRCNQCLQYFGLRYSGLMKFDENLTQKHTGIISSAEVLHPIILSCTDQSAGIETQNCVNGIGETVFRLNFSLAINFINPVAFSESHQAVFRIVPPIILSIYCLIFLSWIINWIMNFTLKNIFHLGLSVTFLMTFIYMILYTIEYKSIVQSKSTKHLTTATTCFRYGDDVFILLSLYASMFFIPDILPFSGGCKKYIFCYISALYIVPYLIVQLMWGKHNAEWIFLYIIIIILKVIEFASLHCHASYTCEVNDACILSLCAYVIAILVCYWALSQISTPWCYILETACNSMKLLVMVLFFYFFKLNRFNRKQYWIEEVTHDIEIEIRCHHYDEIKNKPQKNWQKEKEPYRLLFRTDNPIL